MVCKYFTDFLYTKSIICFYLRVTLVYVSPGNTCIFILFQPDTLWRGGCVFIGSVKSHTRRDLFTDFARFNLSTWWHWNQDGLQHRRLFVIESENVLKVNILFLENTSHPAIKKYLFPLSSAFQNSYPISWLMITTQATIYILCSNTFSGFFLTRILAPFQGFSWLAFWQFLLPKPCLEPLKVKGKGPEWCIILFIYGFVF